jgi:hypothetical protein
LPDTDSGNGGLILGQEATLNQQATLQSLSFYIVAVNSSTLRLGLYDATGGLPGQKLAETALINPVVGWNTAPVISQVTLPAGICWLVYEPSSSALSFKASFNVGPIAIGNATYGPLPPTFPSPVSNAGHWSFYATLTPATPPDPTQFGAWSGIVSLPLVPVHLALLRDGRTLMSDGQSWGPNTIVWDPIGDPLAKKAISNRAPANIFCGAMEQMGDGQILVAGGHITAHVGLAVSNIFNPNTNSWTVGPAMAQARWYPTLTILPDGRLLVTSGETNCDGCDVQIQEVYDPAPSKNYWSQMYSPTISFPPFKFPYYPHVYVLPDGRILVAATTEDPIVSQVLDLKANPPTWTPVGGSPP